MIDILNFLTTAGAEVIASALITLIAGLGANLLFDTSLRPAFRKWLGLKVREAPKSYKEQMSNLTQSLVQASADVDRILQEINDVSQERETAVVGLEKKLDTLVEREKHLQERIKTLENIPIQAADYFASIVEKGEKRSAWRDYTLFGLGVLVSTVIAIILKLVGF